jgi:ketosteroid isomerase-like protein
MNRDTAIRFIDRLHKAQNEFYAGGSGAALQQLLAPNITWTVPGDNRIAGTYRGLAHLPARTPRGRCHNTKTR